MKITQIRNATVLLEFHSGGQPVGLLLDPMLAARGALPTLRYLVGERRRNPVADLPANARDLLARATHGLVTHCQRGHFDHLDRAGRRFLAERRLPVFCSDHDEAYLQARGLATRALHRNGPQPFFHGTVTLVPCVHGRGLVGRLMEHGSGYFIALPGEPSVYIAGDTVLSEEVRACLRDRQPDVAILPAGGARFDLGGSILMGAADMLEAASLTSGLLIANHLEALDHCPTTRAGLAADAARAGLGDRLLVPDDGQSVVVTARRDAARQSAAEPAAVN